MKRDTDLSLRLLLEIERRERPSWKDLTAGMNETEAETALKHLSLLAEQGLIRGTKVALHGFVLWQDLDLTASGHEFLEEQQRTETRSMANKNKVFIVHGHDVEARETMARYLQNIGMDPIILNEQANRGRTVIEKVEANSDVGFAVVLLTPDDEGCVKGGTPEPRARQNVLLELGYFIGCIGRDRVCALKKGTVEIPSDFAGVVWELMDPGGGWKLSLARELEAAGYTIDKSKIR